MGNSREYTTNFIRVHKLLEDCNRKKRIKIRIKKILTAIIKLPNNIVKVIWRFFYE